MARLDPRVTVHLPAKVVGPGGEDKSKDILIEELSLSGALLKGVPTKTKFLTIKPQLPSRDDIRLKGEIVRVDNGHTAVKLYYTDKWTMACLWDLIRQRINHVAACPYCGESLEAENEHCRKCGHVMNFESEEYLSEHFKETFLERIGSRIDRLDLPHLHRVIQMVDRELLRSKGNSPDEEFVGTSSGMLAVFDMIRKVAPLDMNVLILGESGTGKELTARAIHERSERRGKPFVAVNSAAIPEGLIEAELFGYEKGAFTGAHMARRGKFELADGGTLFLDEIGDLPSPLQAKLLRFLEDRVVERIGGRGGKKVNVRIVAATNCNLDEMTGNGDFRNDLFFRLSAFTIKLPPLRSRGEDKVVLARYFFQKIVDVENLSLKGFSPEAIEAIKKHDWPGNVRELINKVRRGVVMASGDYVGPTEMELEMPLAAPVEGALKTQVSRTQKEVVLRVLEDNNYVIARAARELGISRPSLYALMKKHNIQNVHGKSSETRH